VPRAVAPGDVIRLYFQTTKPPKFKRCVVACLSPSPILLLINSEINDFVINSDDLKSLQIMIDTATHKFMDWDSWIDCSQLFGYPKDWLDAAIANNPLQHLGTISEAIRQDIIDAVRETRIHSPKKKAQILDGLTISPDDDS